MLTNRYKSRGTASSWEIFYVRTVVFTVQNLFTDEVISKSKNFKPQKTNTTSLKLLLINYDYYYYHILLPFFLPPPLLPFLPQIALFQMRINCKNLFMEIKVYVWDMGPSAGPKDKEAAGRYKSEYKNFKWERYFGAVPLHKRISSVTLSLICANSWQMQGLVKTVGCVSQQQCVLVVVGLSERVQKTYSHIIHYSERIRN